MRRLGETSENRNPRPSEALLFGPASLLQASVRLIAVSLRTQQGNHRGGRQPSLPWARLAAHAPQPPERPAPPHTAPRGRGPWCTERLSSLTSSHSWQVGSWVLDSNRTLEHSLCQHLLQRAPACRQVYMQKMLTYSTYSQKSQETQCAMLGEGSSEIEHVLEGDTVVKNPPDRAGGARDCGSIPGSGRSPGSEAATQPSILAWKSHGQTSPGSCSLWSCRVGRD